MWFVSVSLSAFCFLVFLEDVGTHPNAHLFCHFFLSRADRRCNRAPLAVRCGAHGGAGVHRRRCNSAPVRRPLCPLLPSSPTTEQEPNQPWRPLYRFTYDRLNEYITADL
jgi:hypothetical protein